VRHGRHRERRHAQARFGEPVMSDALRSLSCPSRRADAPGRRLVQDRAAADSRVDFQNQRRRPTGPRLHLYHSDGTTCRLRSASTPNEEIQHLPAARTYYIKVNGSATRQPVLPVLRPARRSCNTTLSTHAREENDTFIQRGADHVPDVLVDR